MAFEKWLLLQVGTDATIDWVTRTGDVPREGLPWVEADVTIQGHPGIVIMIANGTPEGRISPEPTFRSLQLLGRANSRNGLIFVICIRRSKALEMA